MKKDYTKIATWVAFTYVTLDLVGVLFLPLPIEAQVESLINENQKLRSENQRNIKTFEALYIAKGNRFEKHIAESEQFKLPPAKGFTGLEQKK